MPNTGKPAPESKAEKDAAYNAMVEKFIKSVGELSIDLSRENQRPRVSKVDVYQALYQSLGERIPETKAKKHSAEDRKKLVAKAYVRNCRTQRELKENIRAAAAANQRRAEAGFPDDYDPTEDNTMEVDRSSRRDRSISINSVEMGSLASAAPSTSAMSLSYAGDFDGSRQFDEMSVDLSAGKTLDLVDDFSSTGNLSSMDLGSRLSSYKDSGSEKNGLSPDRCSRLSSYKDSGSDKNVPSADSSSKLSSDKSSASEKNVHSADSSPAAAVRKKKTPRSIEKLRETADDIDEFSSRHSLEGAESLPEDDSEDTDSGNDCDFKLENDDQKQETGARVRSKSEGDLVRQFKPDPVEQIAAKFAGSGFHIDLDAPLRRSSQLVGKEKPPSLRTRLSDPPQQLRFVATLQSPPRAQTSGRKRSSSERDQDEFEDVAGTYSRLQIGSPVTSPRGNRSPLENIGNSPELRARSIERVPEDLENNPGPSGTQPRSPNTPPQERRLSRKRSSSSRRRAVLPGEDAGLLGTQTRSPTTPPRGTRSPRKRSRSTQKAPDDLENVASPSKKSPEVSPLALGSPRKRPSPSRANGQNDENGHKGDPGTPKPRRRFCSPEPPSPPFDDEATDL